MESKPKTLKFYVTHKGDAPFRLSMLKRLTENYDVFLLEELKGVEIAAEYLSASMEGGSSE